MIAAAIKRCAEEVAAASDRSWVIAYSGGKDSTATLKVFLEGARRAGANDIDLSVVYCDTGVENVELDWFVKRTLERMSGELSVEFPNSKVVILRAPVKERFFVRVIGRGYAPPSNRFRWCTKGLRVKPVDRYLASTPQKAAVVLGLRYGESEQRDRSLRAGDTEGDPMWQQQREGNRRDLFLPIVHFNLELVWAAAQGLAYPTAIDCGALEELYRGASGECPMIRSPLSPPCASGRFGCWTCTVVRKDKSAERMIASGKTRLLPYLEFRDWLQAFRSAPGVRWPVRRNGDRGPGPFTLHARGAILRQLQLLEVEVERELLSMDELEAIRALWEIDDSVEKRLGICHRGCRND